MVRKILLTLGLAALLAATACDFTKPPAPVRNKDEIDVFRIGVTESYNFNLQNPASQDFHPHYKAFGIGFIYQSVFDILYFNASTHSIRISSDSRECAIILPTGIRFSDGTTLTSDDVIYSLSSYKQAASNSKLDPLLSKLTIEKLHEKRLIIKSETPVNFEYALSLLNIIGKNQIKIITTDGTSIYTVTGTGPYQLSSVDTNKHSILLKRNKNYHANPPLIKNIEFIYLKDMEATAMALLDGSIDYVPIFGNIEKETLKASSNYTLFRYPLKYCNMIILNPSSPKFHDPRLRKALSLLINRQALAETHRGLPGTRLPTDTFLNFSYPVTKPSVKPRNAGEALRLLKEAGYGLIDGKLMRNGKQLTIDMIVIKMPEIAYVINAVRTVIKYWENAGINCNFSVHSYSDIKKMKQFDAIFTAHLDMDTQSTLESILNSTQNGGTYIDSNFKDEVLENLKKKYKEAFREKDLLNIKISIQERLNEISPVIPLYYDYGFSALGERYKNNKNLISVLNKEPEALGYLAEYGNPSQ